MSLYVVSVRRGIPPDLAERVNRLHAVAVAENAATRPAHGSEWVAEIEETTDASGVPVTV